MAKMVTLSGLVIWTLSAHPGWAADRLLGVQSGDVAVDAVDCGGNGPLG
ncbi:MAG: hypothetical protein ACREQ2_03895 [Candidatus Binatia bacterium]